MAFGTVSDPLLAVALWTGSGAFAASGAILLAVAVLRIRLVRRMARERRLAERWNLLFAECAEAVPKDIPPVAIQDAEPFLLLWSRAQESLRGDAKERLVELALRAGAARHAVRLLKSKRRSSELLAITVLGHLRAAGIEPLLEGLVPVAPSLISLTAAHAFVRISPERAIRGVLDAVARRDDWPLSKVASMLKEVDPSHVGPALAAALYRELAAPQAGPGVARLLKLHGAAHPQDVREAIEAVLERSPDSEALAAALGALTHPDDVAHARRLSAHAHWIVRVAAARALGHLGDRSDIGRLSALLNDPVWWVRRRAAQALYDLPGVTEAELAALLERLDDKYAGETLAQARADRALT